MMKSYELNARDALVLVIDIQTKLIPVMEKGPQVIQRTQVLLETAAGLGIPSAVTEQYPQGLGRTVPDLDPWLPQGERFEKTTFSGCTEGVLAYLRASGRRQIIITGMETHVCVFQTVRDLLDQGYAVFVAGDAVCSRTEENWLNGLSLMREMGAVITNTETVFFDLMKAAGTESFRKLRHLIK